MIFEELELQGVFRIHAEPFEDERGIFRRHFCQFEFAKNGIEATVSQANVSENRLKYTLRGFHYLTSPYRQAKTLSCLRGSFYDIVVDLRPKSDTYLKWIAVEISKSSMESLHIPAGCANAFFTLENETLIHYYFSKPYVKEADSGFRYNDPAFNFEWPSEPSHISKKDATWPDFSPIILKN